MICMLFAASVVRADDWDLAEEDVYGEPRLLDSVFNNTSIDLNSILALILIGVLALITLGPNFLGGGSGSGYGQRNSYYNNAYDYQDGYYNENQFYQRAGKVDGKFFIKRNIFYHDSRNLLQPDFRNFSFSTENSKKNTRNLWRNFCRDFSDEKFQSILIWSLTFLP